MDAGVHPSMPPHEARWRQLRRDDDPDLDRGGVPKDGNRWLRIVADTVDDDRATGCVPKVMLSLVLLLPMIVVFRDSSSGSAVSVKVATTSAGPPIPAPEPIEPTAASRLVSAMILSALTAYHYVAPNSFFEKLLGANRQ
jgi:hypothetical protein